MATQTPARVPANTVTKPPASNTTVSTTAKIAQTDVVLENNTGGCYVEKILTQGQ